MTPHWSSSNVFVEHKDVQATSMALADPHHLVALSGRRCVALVDLHSPETLVKKLLWQSKWEVGASEWSPRLAECLALACNQRAEILLWKDGGDLVPKCTLKAHTRAISDLNWSPFDPNRLATASIDASIHLWDLRDTRKPSTSLTAVAGASQVKWNKLTDHRLATTHDGDVRVWDTRMSSNAIYYLGAHLAMIHGLDWNPCIESQLCTSCQDGTIKFWDLAADTKQPIKRLFTGSVVWKARYTPFRDGVVTAVVPQLRRGENSLVLWNSSNLLVHTFVGPTNVVLDFAWATTESRDYDLVTWSKDQSLRMWHVDTNLQKLCRSTEEGQEEVGSPVLEAPIRSPNPLQQEFALVNLNIPNLTIDELDASKRTCTVTAVCGKLQICVKMVFPPAYPNNAAPLFQFLRCSPNDIGIQQKLTKVLTEVSGMQVRRNRSCLEPCLRQLVTSLEQCLAEESHHVDQDKPVHEPVKIVLPAYSTFRDANIPFPRTSGAKFGRADLLLCFHRPPHMRKINAPTEVTPRQLSALNAYLSCHVLPPGAATSPSSPFYGAQNPVAGGVGDVSISSFYQPQDGSPDPLSPKLAGKHKGPGKSAPPSYCGSVLVYSIAKILPINMELAQKYQLGPGDLPTICSLNATLAAEVNRPDLVQVWNMAAHILDATVQPNTSTNRDDRPWALYPICRPMIQSHIVGRIDHYLQNHDIQTVAMLCCIYSAQDQANQKSVHAVPDLSGTGPLSSKWWTKPGGSPYHTVVPADTSLDGWNIVSNLRRNRSNSWSDALDETNRILEALDPKTSEDESYFNDIRYLDPSQSYLYDHYKKGYAEVLYRWNLLEQRAQVLKHCTVIPEKTKCIELKIVCQHCKRDTTAPQCAYCKKFSLYCIICRNPVRGLSNICMYCGHGGHTRHVMEWFQDNDVCPTGCGCNCYEVN